MSLADLKAALSQAGNLSQLKGLSAAYGVLLGGIPSLDGYAYLIKNNNDTNFGAGAGPLFNDENIIINTLNALYQGNATARANFDLLLGGGAAGTDPLTEVYNFVIPAASRSAEGLSYFKSQSGFYAARAAELGIPGETGTAVVAFASLTKIAVDNKIGGLGDQLNDLIGAINNGTASIPQNSTEFTELEVADGTQFDAGDIPTLSINNYKTPAGPIYSFAPLSTNSVQEGTNINANLSNSLTFTVIRTGDISKPGTVALSFSGTADASDYAAITDAPTITEKFVTFGAGHNQSTFSIATYPDFLIEPNETVIVSLGAIIGGGTLGAVRSITATIANDDTADVGPVYSIAASPSSVLEGNTGTGATITFTVSRTGDSSKAGSVRVIPVGTADVGVDYDLSTDGTVTFAAGASTATFTATVKPDTEVEPNETLDFRLVYVTGGGAIANDRALVTITNDDGITAGPVYSIAVSPSSVIEGNTGQGAAITYTVTRTGDISKAGAVGLTYLGTATNGVDYDLSTATSIVSFAAGASTATLTATVRPDTQVEPNETITVLIDSVGGGGTIGTANSATATITNDDSATVGPTYAISVAPSSVAEGTSGPGNAITFTVTRTGDVSQPGSVAVALSGTANGSDYTSDLVGGAVSFNAGHNQVTFTVTTTPDATVEPDETVIATLGAITGGGALGATTTATATITNDDTAPQALVQATNTQVITDTTGIDFLTVTALAPSVVSDLKGGANVVSLADGVDISGASYLYDFSSGATISYDLAGASASMTVAQVTKVGNAPGYNTVTLKDSSTSSDFRVNTSIEKFILFSGNDAITLQTVQGQIRTVDLSSGGSDTVRIEHAAGTTEGYILISGFTPANDKISSNPLGKGSSNKWAGTLDNPNEAVRFSSGGSGAVIINSQTLGSANFLDLSDGGSVEQAIAGAINNGLSGVGDPTSTSTAFLSIAGVGTGIYQFAVTKPDINTDLNTSEIKVSIVGVIEGVSTTSLGPISIA